MTPFSYWNLLITIFSYKLNFPFWIYKLNISRISQLELKQQIESLNEELQNVREALNNHPDLDPYVKKLISCKHKVTVVLNVLQTSQVSCNFIKIYIVKIIGFSFPKNFELLLN